MGPCGPDGRDTSGHVMAGTARTEPDHTPEHDRGVFQPSVHRHPYAGLVM